MIYNKTVSRTSSPYIESIFSKNYGQDVRVTLIALHIYISGRIFLSS